MIMVDSKTTNGTSIESLNFKLDELFERYLLLLDEYQTSQQQLSSQLSAGYMSLAKANFSSNGYMRYGQDFFDERMQAGRHVTIRGREDHAFPKMIVDRLSTANTESQLESESLVAGDAETDEIPLAPSAFPAASNEEAELKRRQSDSEAKLQTSIDPLKWFGILVPPALRSAQASFVEAVEGPIPKLITLTGELRQLDSEISKTRKSIKKLR